MGTSTYSGAASGGQQFRVELVGGRDFVIRLGETGWIAFNSWGLPIFITYSAAEIGEVSDKLNAARDLLRHCRWPKRLRRASHEKMRMLQEYVVLLEAAEL